MIAIRVRPRLVSEQRYGCFFGVAAGLGAAGAAGAGAAPGGCALSYSEIISRVMSIMLDVYSTGVLGLLTSKMTLKLLAAAYSSRILVILLVISWISRRFSSLSSACASSMSRL